MEWQPYRLGSGWRGRLTGTTGRILAGATFPCAYCHGTGNQLHMRSRCPVCRGKGVMSIKEPIERCDACRGLGRVSGTQLPCLKCRGAGVVTIKKTDRSKERKAVEAWR